VVLNGIALVTNYTEMMPKLHDMAGLMPSRNTGFKIPASQVINDFTQLSGK